MNYMNKRQFIILLLILLFIGSYLTPFLVNQPQVRPLSDSEENEITQNTISYGERDENIFDVFYPESYYHTSPYTTLVQSGGDLAYLQYDDSRYIEFTIYYDVPFSSHTPRAQPAFASSDAGTVDSGSSSSDPTSNAQDATYNWISSESGSTEASIMMNFPDLPIDESLRSIEYPLYASMSVKWRLDWAESTADGTYDADRYHIYVYFYDWTDGNYDMWYDSGSVSDTFHGFVYQSALPKSSVDGQTAYWLEHDEWTGVKGSFSKNYISENGVVKFYIKVYRYAVDDDPDDFQLSIDFIRLTVGRDLTSSSADKVIDKLGFSFTLSDESDVAKLHYDYSVSYESDSHYDSSSIVTTVYAVGLGGNKQVSDGEDVTPFVDYGVFRAYFEFTSSAMLLPSYIKIIVTIDQFAVEQAYAKFVNPTTGESRVTFYNQRGDVIPFEKFHTYKASMPSKLIQYAPDINDDDLIAWFRFNENTGTSTYDWKNGYEGTISGASWATGYIGKALEFDGSDDYVDIPDNLPITPTLFSIEFWFKPNGENGDSSYTTQALVDLRGQYHIWVAWVEPSDGTNPNSVRFEISDGSNYPNLYSNTECVPGQWYHVVAVYDGSEMRLYINGRLDIKTSTTITPQTMDYDSLIGKDYRLDLDRLWFYGIIDEVRIYNCVLSPEEVWWHYALVFYYDGYQDLLGRDTTYFSGEYVSGVFGYATRLDGINDYILYNDDDGLDLCSEFTIISFVSVEGYPSVVGHILRKLGGGSGYFVRVTTTGEFEAKLWSGGTKVADVCTSGANMGTDRWCLLVVTYSFDTLKLYVNGELKGTGTSSDTIGSTSKGLYLGTSEVLDEFFEGKEDEVIILRDSLPPEMVSHFWNFTQHYLGGYYVDEEFRATWDIEQDSPSGASDGLAVSGADTSGWTYGGSSGYTSRSISSDGDNIVLHGEYPEDGKSGYIFFIKPVSDVDLEDYPFLEIRWRGDSNTTTGAMHRIACYVSNGTSKKWVWVLSDPTEGDFGWMIDRFNLWEKVQEYLGTDQYHYLEQIIIGQYEITDGAVSMDTYIDWLRVYKISSSATPYSIQNLDSRAWVASIGGVLEFSGYFDEDGTLERIYFDIDVPDIDITPDLYVQFRVKGYVMYGVFRDELPNLVQYIRYYSDWTVVTLRPYDFGWEGNKLTSIRIGIYDDFDQVGPLSGQQSGYFDYIRIGYVQEQIADTSWQAVLDNVYQHPKNSYVWFNITDRFGNQLIYEPRYYAEFQEFTLPVYSWKIRNQHHNFVHIELTQSGTSNSWSEWLAPYEVAEYLLYAGSYNLRLTYTNGTYVDYDISVSTDTYFLITGDTLWDVMNGISNLNGTLAGINGTVNIINARVVNIDGNLTIINANIGTLNTTINAINSTVNVMNSTVNSIYVDILQINDTLLIMNATINTVSGNVTIINATVNEIRQTTTLINSTVNLINSTMSDVYAYTIEINGTIGQLNVTVARIDDNVQVIYEIDTPFWLRAYDMSFTDRYLVFKVITNWRNGTVYVYDNGTLVDIISEGSFMIPRSYAYGWHNITLVISSGEYNITVYDQYVVSSVFGDMRILFFTSGGRLIPFDTFVVYVDGERTYVDTLYVNMSATFNVTVLDRFGYRVHSEIVNYSREVAIIIDVNTVKIMSSADDTYYHLYITREGYNASWHEFIGPYEIAKYYLYDGNYTIRLISSNGSVVVFNVEITEDKFYLVKGYTLYDVYTKTEIISSDVQSLSDKFAVVESLVGQLEQMESGFKIIVVIFVILIIASLIYKAVTHGKEEETKPVYAPVTSAYPVVVPQAQGKRASPVRKKKEQPATEVVVPLRFKDANFQKVYESFEKGKVTLHGKRKRF